MANDNVIESLKLKGLVDIYNIAELLGLFELVTSNNNKLMSPILYGNDNDIIESLKILNDKSNINIG